MDTIAPWEYYSPYIGHQPEHLASVLHCLRKDNDRCVVFLAGDSTLDNKHWLFRGKDKESPTPYNNSEISGDALGGYREVLSPPRMIKDVAYWLMFEGAADGRFAALNTAVEESTLQGRSSTLRLQDKFIQDNITANDVLVISAGGNDVALRPSRETQIAMMKLMQGQQEEALAHFVQIFKNEAEYYAKSLVAKVKPRAIIVCMLYFLDESNNDHGFAEGTLTALNYNQDPSFLQGIQRMVFQAATRQINVEGTKVIPLPLYDCLDGKDTTDYISRVEPSVLGGQKMGRLLAEKIKGLF